MAEDLTLTTRLVADASGMNATLKQAEKGVQDYANTAANAARTQASAATQGTGATNTALAAQQMAMQRARASSNQLREAYRQLPMQITDITTSLASGMPVWMVAIQQGGQIRDAFGGVGPAAKGMLSVLTPLRLMIGGTAAALAATALAYFRGSAEAEAYTRAIVMSGNAAGTSSGRLAAMAENIDAVVGTQAKAAEVLAALAAGGRVADGTLQAVGETVVRMERSLGLATEEAVGMFSALGKDPVAASAKLNQEFRYLTISVYEQIKALHEHGREGEAAAAAQQAFRQAMDARAAELETRLGTIQRAWRGVKEYAAEAWDAMLGIGRQGTLQQQLAQVTAALNAPPRSSLNPQALQQRLGDLRQRQAELQEQLRLEQRAAELQAQQAAATEKHIATEKERERAVKASADAYRALAGPLANDIALLQAELAAGGQLADTRKAELRTLQEIADKRGVIGARAAEQLAQQVARRTELAQAVAFEQQVAATREAGAKREQQALAQAQAAAAGETQALAERNRRLAEETETLGLAGQALLAVEQARISSAIAVKEQALAGLQLAGTYSSENEALEKQIELLRQQQGLLSHKAERQLQVDNAKDAEALRRQQEQEAAARSQALEDSITEGILSGFRNGNGIAETFLRELKAQFARTVLQPHIKLLADAGSGLLNQFIGGLGSAIGSGGGGFAGSFGDGLPTPGFSRVGEGYASGTDYVPRDMLALVHEGERITPKKYNPAAGGGGARATQVWAPNIAVSIDARSDAAQVQALAYRGTRAALAEYHEARLRAEI